MLQFQLLVKKRRWEIIQHKGMLLVYYICIIFSRKIYLIFNYTIFFQINYASISYFPFKNYPAPFQFICTVLGCPLLIKGFFALHLYYQMKNRGGLLGSKALGSSQRLNYQFRPMIGLEHYEYNSTKANQKFLLNSLLLNFCISINLTPFYAKKQIQKSIFLFYLLYYPHKFYHRYFL